MQQKPNTKLQDLLKSNPAKTRKLSEHSKIEQNRLAKLNSMFDELRRGENVQNRRLATWLTEDEFESLESDWESQQQIREELRNKPDELKRYENKLYQTTFNYSKAERFRKRGNEDKSTKFRNLSNSQCGEALEILQEIVDADASLHMWSDRELDFGHVSLVDAHLGNLPRVVTSRSQDTQNSDSRLMCKREVKIGAAEMAVGTLLKIKIEDTQKRKGQESVKLREFLESPFLE